MATRLSASIFSGLTLVGLSSASHKESQSTRMAFSCASGKIFMPMILGLALIESLVIYALIISILLMAKI